MTHLPAPAVADLTVLADPLAPAACARCAASIAAWRGRMVRDGRLLCADCQLVECWDCGAATADVIRRSVGHRTGAPAALCPACCSTYAGREWMRR